MARRLSGPLHNSSTSWLSINKNPVGQIMQATVIVAFIPLWSLRLYFGNHESSVIVCFHFLTILSCRSYVWYSTTTWSWLPLKRQTFVICQVLGLLEKEQNVKCFELGLIGACFALQGLFFLRVVSSKGKWRVEQGEEAVAAVAVEIRPEDPGMCRSRSRLPQEEEEDREVLRQRKQLKLRLLFHRDHL